VAQVWKEMRDLRDRGSNELEAEGLARSIQEAIF